MVRDWVLRFNAHGPDGLTDRKAPGPAASTNEAHRQALAAIIESGPIPAVHGVVRWRLIDLCQWLWEEFRVSVARQTLSRELRGDWLSQASALARATMPRLRERSSFLKKLPGDRGGDRA